MPSSPKEIDRAISSLKINKLLIGFRGKKGINKNHLIKNLVKLSNYIIDPINKIHQLEINPLFVYNNKAVVVDAIIWKK